MSSESGRARVLVVEDEAPILEGLVDLLTFHGMAVTGCERGDRGLALALGGGWDLLVLDVMLPGCDGLTLCERARAADAGVAILMLTAKARDEDVLRGFTAGCDDYLPKPFALPVFLARVRALLRRAGIGAARTLRLGELTVEVDELRATGPGGAVELSRREAEVLAQLAQASPKTVSREELLRRVWGYPQPDRVETRALDMHVVKLRRKLERLGLGAERLQTVRGRGYRLEVDP